MKAIDELICRNIDRLHSGHYELSTESVIQDLEQLKEQLKEQHKEDVVKAYDKGREETQKRYMVVNHSITAEQYYQQTQ